RLVSFVDMPKTWLSLAGAEIPSSFQGRVFFGKGEEAEPKHHLGFRERADERLDHVRLMRDKRFAYHKNYMPYAPAGQHLAYLWKAPATPAWEQHHRAGKTDEVTGRFFRPRVSEEFYDNESDFDNVKNLINEPKYQARIAELKAALRKKQLELFDSGLLPEAMRMRRAAENGITIYEMVRNKKLYPLEAYLDASDKALARDAKNLDDFVKAMNHQDEGIRWWGIVGLHLLEKDAASANSTLKRALKDDCHEVRMMAAWSLVKLGDSDDALACLEDLLFNTTKNEMMLHNILDWMGEPVLPLVKEHLAKGGSKKGKYGISILGRVGELQGW
ncbi:HEAT repeat domain-containing protein, partial [Akkermansiaceae bacterium]|nr:HEAT repeat domain-containing protein [Akkermansiaceae bacterium]